MSACIGKFSQLGEQLQSIISAFLADQELMDLIACQTNVDPYTLINTRLFYDLYKPPTNEEVVYVCAYFDKFSNRDSNPYFKYGRLNVTVIYHRNLISTPEGKLRHYEIMHRIDEILNRNDVSGSVSKDWFNGANYYPVSELYNSFTLTYTNWNL